MVLLLGIFRLRLSREDVKFRVYVGSFPLTVTVTTMGYRSYKNPLNKAPLRTVTGRGNDPRFMEVQDVGSSGPEGWGCPPQRLPLQKITWNPHCYSLSSFKWGYIGYYIRDYSGVYHGDGPCQFRELRCQVTE